MAARPTTLRDVAKKAGVSVATVSYVLSGKGRMSPERRHAIEAMLREAGIRPRYKRYPVFYIADHREFSDMHAFTPFLQLYDGLNESLEGADVDLRTEFLRPPTNGTLRDQIERILSYRPGAVVLDSNLKDNLAEVGHFFEKEGVPAVQVGHTLHAEDIDAVVVDNFGGAYAGTKHLIAGGHRRIALIRWNVSGDPASSKKYAGYQCAIEEAKLPLDPSLIVESGYTKTPDGVQPARVAIDQLLALRDPPTAVLVDNSFISPPLIYPNDPSEPQVPERIRKLDIIHFEAWHTEWMEQVMAGKLCYPPRHVKLLQINWQELGRSAGKHVLARMEGLAGKGQVFQLVPSLYLADGDEYRPL